MNDFIKDGQSNKKEVENELEQHIAMVLQQAEKYHIDGQVQSATEVYRAILEIRPNNPQANYKLGVLFFELKQYHEALPFFRIAIEASPKTTTFWYTYIDALLLAEQHSHAEKALNVAEKYCTPTAELNELRKRVADIQPAPTSSKGQIQPAVAPAVPKQNRMPSRSETDKLARLERKKSIKEIELFAKQLVERYPSHPMGWYAVLSALYALEKNTEGLNIALKAKQAIPKDGRIHAELAKFLRVLGQLENARDEYREIIRLYPPKAEVLDLYSELLLQLNNFSEAEKIIHQAINIKPSSWRYNVLGNILSGQTRLKEAEASYRQALKLENNNLAKINLGLTLRKQGRLNEAVELQREAAKNSPENIEYVSNLLMTLNYSSLSSNKSTLETAKKFGEGARKRAKNLYVKWLANALPTRLKVGLVSGDLYRHPVGFFLQDVIKNIDPDRIEIFIYSNGTKDDALTTVIKSCCVSWKNIAHMDDQSTAQLIWQDGVHILIDLSGHTGYNRLSMFAWKPAPVQTTWLGYFATTGVVEIDYILVDPISVPPSQHAQFTEEPWYLPDTRLCFSVPESPSPVASPPMIKNRFITFGNFQNTNKVNDEVLKLWATIFAAVPDSKFRWQCSEFGDIGVQDLLLTRLRMHGIDTSRVRLVPSVQRGEYLNAHQEVDLLLDTFPFPGGTTTCEALFMGVPTLTLAGETLISRQGASMLTAAGLGNWVVYSKEDYVNKAIELAGNTKYLSTLRQQLRQQVLASPLFDAKLFARNFETALWGMWEAKKPEQSYLQAFVNADELVLSINQASPLASQAKNSSTNIISNRVNSTDQKIELVIVSATRLTQEIFWQISALGISLKRHMSKDTRLDAQISFENTRGLSEVFNDSISKADQDQTLVFIHDDVWINQDNFLETVMAGLEKYDVIGVIGNKRRLKNQTGWRFLDIKQEIDRETNLSGCIGFGLTTPGIVENYGPAPVPCELLDGVFMAVRKSTLQNSHLEFDTLFDFSFYDMDFCRTARQKNIKLGTWLIDLTHQSQGRYGTSGWHNNLKKYQEKWHENVTNSALENSIEEAIFKAGDIYKSGNLATAQYLYHEVLKHDPTNREAKDNLNHIQSDLNKIESDFIALKDKLKKSIKSTKIVDLEPTILLFFEKGLHYQQAGDNERAKDMYTEVLNVEPLHAESQHNLAFIEISSKGLCQVLPRFLTAISSEPSIDRYWVSYINVLLDVGAKATAASATKVGQNYGLSQQSVKNISSILGQELNPVRHIPNYHIKDTVEVYSCSAGSGENSQIDNSHKEVWNDIPLTIIRNNRKGLSEAYNEILNTNRKSNGGWIVFAHDDVYIDDNALALKLTKARKDHNFDIVGLAGCQNALIGKHNLWNWMAAKEDLRGYVSHPLGKDQVYVTCFGPTPARVTLIDGLFIAVYMPSIAHNAWKFNENYKFHHYDISSCIDANKFELKIGVFPINVIHTSSGLSSILEPNWAKSNKKFLREYLNP